MSKTKLTSVLIALIMFGLNLVMAAEPNKMDPFKMNKLLGRGVNMGNALDAPAEGEWGFTLDEKYFQAAKDAGFDSVRIPARWSAHCLDKPPYTIDPNFLKRVDWAVNCGLSRNMPVMLDVHHYLELLSDPAGQKDRFLAIWQQLAEHYKDYPDTLILEPLNEPMGKLGVSEWNGLLKQAIAVIRKSNPDRILVIGPAWANTIGNLKSLDIPKDDRNIIVTIHYYEPLEFTHQGASWITDRDSNAWMGTKWETDADKKAVVKAFDIAAAWAKENNRPMNLGEFGAYSKADMDSRARWTKFVADAAIERGMSFHYWQFDSDFAVYDIQTNTWVKPLKDAILPPKK